MNRAIKTMAAGLLTASMTVCSGLPVLAAYEESSGLAGSTTVYCEVGFNGGNAYAKVWATDDVDANMNGEAYYYDGVTKYMIGGFDQRTSGEVRVSRDDEDVAIASCQFDIGSSDGDYSHYSYAH